MLCPPSVLKRVICWLNYKGIFFLLRTDIKRHLVYRLIFWHQMTIHLGLSNFVGPVVFINGKATDLSFKWPFNYFMFCHNGTERVNNKGKHTVKHYLRIDLGYGFLGWRFSAYGECPESQALWIGAPWSRTAWCMPSPSRCARYRLPLGCPRGTPYTMFLV